MNVFFLRYSDYVLAINFHLWFFQEKKKSYRSQKKEVAREVMNSASDKSIVLMADWLKVRGTLKGWTKLWCVCRPAMLVIYKSEKMKVPMISLRVISHEEAPSSAGSLII